MTDRSAASSEDPFAHLDIPALELAFYWRCTRELSGPEHAAEFIDEMVRLTLHAESRSLRQMAARAIAERNRTPELSA